jgi:hypothetical protein
MASGDTLVVLTPLGSEAPASSFATLGTRNAHPVLDFDAASTESAVWTAILPRHYSGGGITIYLHWSAATATSGNVVWQSSFEYISDGSLDIDSDGFASAITWSAAATSGTSGIVTISNQAHTDGAQLDSVVAGGSFRLKIDRVGGDGSDTMSGDAELLAVELKET